MYEFDDSISVHRMKCVAAYHRDANLWRFKISYGDPLFAVPTPLPFNIIGTPLPYQKTQINIHVGMAYRYIPSKLIIILSKFFFLFIGRELTT